MKKIYLFAVAALMGSMSFGQITYDLQLDLTSPASGSTVAPGSISVSFNLINNGPDAVPAGDTLYFSYVINPQLGAGAEIFGMDGTPNGANGAILPQAFPTGVTVPSSALEVAFGEPVVLDLSSRPAGTAVAIVCWGANSAALTAAGDTRDSDPDNNSDIFLLGTLSVGNAGEISFNVFPNPATDVLNVTATSEEIASVSVLSLDGKLVSTTKGGTVDVSTLTSGVYIYEATTVSGQKAINKFVKK